MVRESGRSRAILVVAAALASTFAADAAAQSVSVCAHRDDATQSMVLTISNGCVSSSQAYLGSDIAVEVDQELAAIRVSGNFNYAPNTSQVATTDCMGSKRVDVEIADTEARRYGVSHDGAYLGVIDLTGTSGPVCAGDAVKDRIPRPLSMDWKAIDLEEWQPRTANSAIRLIAPIYQHFPDSLELAPSIRIEIEKRPGHSSLQASVRIVGLSDDSVSGEEYIAEIVGSADGWSLTGLWRRWLCARGPRAGQWTTEACS
jgi:hypothetical protein